MSAWFKTMKARSLRFPDRYIVLDCETTGLVTAKDLIVQIGFCIVVDHEPVVNNAIILDWTRHKATDQSWLRERMEYTRKQMESRGSKCHFTYERLKKEGCEPTEVLAGIHGILSDARSRGDSFVFHNGVGFDIPILHNHFRLIGPQFAFLPDEIMDTGLMEKASQMGLYPNKGEVYLDFLHRVRRKWSKGTSWSLSTHCIPKYGLTDGIDVSASVHDAGFDTLMTHRLLEKYRELAQPVAVHTT